MSARARIFAFGFAAVLVVAGVVCAILVGGVVGDILSLVLVAAGLAGAVLLVFLEVGLSEDRDLALQRERSRGSALRRLRARRGGWVMRRPRRPE